IRHEDEVCYVGGHTEGSKYSIVPILQSAKWFPTEEALREVFQDREWVKRNEYIDGSSSPPSLIWSGLGINNQRPKAQGIVEVCKLDIQVLESFAIQGELLP